MKSESHLRYALKIALVAMFYLGMGQLGKILLLPGGNVLAIWPSSGIALAAVIIWGSRIWPGIWLGAFFLTIEPFFELSTNSDVRWKLILVGGGIGLGTALQAIAGAMFFRRMDEGRPMLDHAAGVFRFLFFSGMISCSVSANFMAAAICLAGFFPWDDFGKLWGMWWMGNLAGVLLITPVLLHWKRPSWNKWTWRLVLEIVALVILLVSIGKNIFNADSAQSSYQLYAIIPFLIWAAIRFGQREAAITTLIISVLAISGTVIGKGPFATPSLNLSLQRLQGFIAFAATTSLLFGAMMKERRRALERLSEETVRLQVAMNALQQNEEHTRTIIDTAYDAFISIDADGLITNWNHQAEITFGWTRDEAKGRRLSETIIPLQFREAHERGLKHFLTTGHGPVLGKRLELAALHRDGSEFPVEITISPIKRGDTWSFNAFVRNISERKQAEKSRQRLAEIVESSNDAIISKDLNSIVQSWNPAAERIFGYRAEEIIGKSISILFPDDRQKEEAEILDRIARGEPIEQFESVRCRKDGSLFHVSITISPMKNAMGKVVGASNTVRNITARKEMELVLAAQTEELRRSNSELEQFAYVASHDLQEPLRTITNFTQLLARQYKEKLDAEANEFISYTVQGAKRMKQLIEDLLNYSRVGREQGKIEMVQCDPLLDQVLENLRFVIEQNNAVITHDPLPELKADSLLFRQLFQNLIGNALKFHGSEPPRINISARPEGNEWLFAVRDNGIGIDPRYAERIFVVFQRLHGRSEYPGTGIGLAICQKIVQHHGGRIWVESKKGEGSTFYFTWPRAT